MLRASHPFAIAIAVLFSISSVRAEFTPIAGWDEQVFPSYLIATAAMKTPAEQDANTLGDGYGIFGVSVTARTSDEPIKVTVTCDSYAEVSEFSGSLPTEGETYKVHPKMRYKFDKLGNCRQATPCTVVFKVEQGDDVVEERTATITMRSINDCPFGLVNGDEIIDMNIVFAAYVNEQHPFVDKLLREALDIGMVDSFTGYQSNDPNAVLAQVYAIWDLMVNRDLRYSNITTTAAISAQSHSQHVRLLEETINNTQANCVDGSVLFASILRKVGIDAALIVTSDHCYLGFWADREHERLYGLETTMVSGNFQDQEIPDIYDAVISEDMRWDYSWGSFVHGMITGTENLRVELEKEKQEIAFIDVTSARLGGVLPIPFQNNVEFTSVQYDYAETDDTVEVEAESDTASDESESVDEASQDEVVEWDTETNGSSDANAEKNRNRKSKSTRETVVWE